MDDFLKTLDWRMRACLSGSLSILAVVLLWLGIRSSVSGPWFISAVASACAALCINGSARSWPSKLPERAQDLLDRWKQARTRSTKSRQGRFVWNLGRSLIGAIAAWHFGDFIGTLAPQVLWILTFGLGISFGFFGLEAALWSGLFVGVAAHLIASAGMSVDFSNPASREAFLFRWYSGAEKLSWLWLVGFAFAAPVWIGLAATVQKVKDTISEEVAQRKAQAADKKRIEARRERLKSKTETNGDDPLDSAKRKLEEAQERVKALGRGNAANPGTEILGAASAEGGARELTGVEKLENANMAETLKSYGLRARSIADSKKLGIDVHTEACRAFDRVVMGMSDAQIAYLRNDNDALSGTLLAYYDELCAIEDLAMRGGDGEVVSSSYTNGESDRERSYDDLSTGYGDPPSGDSDEDGLGGLDDLLDGGSSAHVGSRAAQAAAGMEMMLANVTASVVREGEDGTPLGGGDLPVEDDISEKETGSMHKEAVEVPSDLGESAGIKPDLGRASLDGEDIVEVGVLNKVHDAPEVDGETPATAGADAAKGNADDVGEGDHAAADPLGNKIGDSPDRPTGSEDHSPAESKAQEPLAANDDGAGSEDQGDQQADQSTDQGSMNVDPAELKRAAGRILAGQIDRALIVQSAGWFADRADVAKAVGLDEDLFAQGFAAYEAGKNGYALETALRECLDDGNATLETVGTAVSALSEANWEADPALMDRVNRWIADATEAEQAKEREEAARLAKEEADRVAQVETARLAQEKIDREASEAAARAAEERRKSDQKAKCSKFAIRILAGQKDDETLDSAADLFPTVAEFADALDLDEATVEGRFQEFKRASEARQNYAELVSAYRDENVSRVEALLEYPESFEGYSHPTVELDVMRKWAASERERERLKGLIDGSDVVQETGGASRRAFLIKRTRISPEMAKIVDEDLPKAMRLVQNLENAIDLMGGSSAAVEAPLEEAKAQVRMLASQVVKERNGKGREFVQAFLPEDVKVPGLDVWDMLVELASGTIPDQAPVTPPEQAEAIVDHISEHAITSSPTRNMAISFDHTGRKSLAEVQKLNAAEELRVMSHPGKLDLARETKCHIMTLREIYGDQYNRYLSSENQDVFASVLDGSGAVIGRVLIRTCEDAPAWYHHESEQIALKNVEDGNLKVLKRDSFYAMVSSEIVQPNGNPDAVIAYALLSPVITDNGITSFEPVLEDFAGQAAILQLKDGEGLKRFVRSFQEWRTAA